jgi:hypothetical protein
VLFTYFWRKEMSDSIYALYHYLNGKDEKIYFYVGHTNNPTRRFDEHRRAANSETKKEDVYQYIRNKVLCQIFEMEVLCDCKAEEPDDYEDFYVIKLIRDGHELQNMKHGDAKSYALTNEINSLSKNNITIENVRQLREYRAGERARKLRERVLNEEVVVHVIAPGVLEARKKAAIKAKKAAIAKHKRDQAHEIWIKEKRQLFEEENRSNNLTPGV